MCERSRSLQNGDEWTTLGETWGSIDGRRSYYTLPLIESLDSFWKTRAERSRCRDKGILWAVCTNMHVHILMTYRDDVAGSYTDDDLAELDFDSGRVDETLTSHWHQDCVLDEYAEQVFAPRQHVLARTRELEHRPVESLVRDVTARPAFLGRLNCKTVSYWLSYLCWALYACDWWKMCHWKISCKEFWCWRRVIRVL